MTSKEIRTYNMATPRGRIEFVTMTLISFGFLLYSIFEMASTTDGWPAWWLYVVFFLSLVVLTAHLAPAWYNEIVMQDFDRQREHREILAIDPHIVGMRLEIELQKEKQTTVSMIRHLTDKQIDFAHELNAVPSVDIIDGIHTYWKPDGVTNIPLWFVIMWDKKYEALKGNIPSDHEFDKDARRDECRRYNRVIREELMKRGYVRPAGGPITARWKNGISGADGLGSIGFYHALVVAEAFEMEAKEERQDETI